MENKNSQNGTFMNGFVWGLLLGSIVVFLLGTKKGKKLLKILTEEGIEGMAELGELINDFGQQDEETIPEKKNERDVVSAAYESKVQHRRFFKRPPSGN